MTDTPDSHSYTDGNRATIVVNNRLLGVDIDRLGRRARSQRFALAVEGYDSDVAGYRVIAEIGSQGWKDAHAFMQAVIERAKTGYDSTPST